MSRRIFLLFAIVLCSVTLFAQSEPKMPKGVRFIASPVKPITTDNAEVGQAIEMVVAAELQEVGKGTVLPKGAHLYGRVTHVVPRLKNRPAELSLVIERAEWTNGSLPMRAVMFLKQPVEPVRTILIPNKETTTSAPVEAAGCGGSHNFADSFPVAVSTVKPFFPSNAFQEVKLKLDNEHITVAVSPKHDIVLTKESQITLVQAGV